MNNLKKLRKVKGLSQIELAKKLGVSQETVSKWESGKVIPDIKNLISMKTIFNVSIDYLLDFDIVVPTLEKNELNPSQQKMIKTILNLKSENQAKIAERAEILEQLEHNQF